MNRLGTKPYAQHVWVVKNQHQIVPHELLATQIEAGISEFLNSIAPATSAIKSLSAENFVEVGIYVFVQEAPPIRLSSNQIEAIAAMGASVDFDIVLCAEDGS